MGFDLFEKAGLLLWPILALSVLGAAVTLQRIAYFWVARRRNRAVLDRVLPLLDRGRVEDASDACASVASPVGHVLTGLLSAWSLPEAKRKALVGVAAERALREVELGLRPLAIIARVSPLIGLLGTVLGLVEAFIAFSAGGGQPDPTQLADGIWQALLTTVAGLSVAIPAIFAYEWCAARADEQLFAMKEAVAQTEARRGD